MKVTKKLLALVLAVVMIMAMAVTSSAATVTILNSQKDTDYTFYQLFEYDDEKDWYQVTNEKWKAVLSAYFEFDTNGYILKKTTEMEDDDLAAVLKNLIPDGVPSKTVTGDTVPVEADLELGYYLMISELGGTDSRAALAEISPEGLTIREKNTPDGLPYIKKTYADGTTDGDYSIGDTAKFKVVITAHEGGQAYTVHDIASDLTVDYGSVKVETSTGDNVDYDVKTSDLGDSCTFHIDLAFENALEAYDTIIITYNATVTGDNPTNQASLSTGVGSDDPGTSSYNYSFTVKKTDAAGTKVLEGAKFILSRVKEIDEVDTTQYAKFDSTGKLTGWTTVKDDATPLTTNKDGIFTVSGLAAGYYTLEETTAPIGYKKLDKPINVTITANLTDKKPNGTATITASGDYVSAADNIVSIKNNKIDPLPETGGMGTTLFYVLGGLMVAAALVLLTTKKRMAA